MHRLNIEAKAQTKHFLAKHKKLVMVSNVDSSGQVHYGRCVYEALVFERCSYSYRLNIVDADANATKDVIKGSYVTSIC